MVKFCRITLVAERNQYKDVPVIPFSAKPVTGPHKVGDYVEIAPHGYIRARYRIPDENGTRSPDRFEELFGTPGTKNP